MNGKFKLKNDIIVPILKGSTLSTNRIKLQPGATQTILNVYLVYKYHIYNFRYKVQDKMWLSTTIVLCYD